MTQYDVAYVRSQFPALKRMIDGRPAAYLDGPGGTQTPQRVLDAVHEYLVDHNANYGGRFATSEETDATIAEAHAAGADFLGCDAGRGQLRRQHDHPHVLPRAKRSGAACSPATRS